MCFKGMSESRVEEEVCDNENSNVDNFFIQSIKLNSR